MFQTAVGRFSHDNTDILLYEAFMRSSVLSSAPALWFPLIGTLQLHGLWACPILLFTATLWIFLSFPLSCSSAALWPTAEWHRGDSHPGWNTAHHSHVTAHTLWQPSLTPHSSKLTRRPKWTSCARRHCFQGNKEISHALMSQSLSNYGHLHRM